LRPKLLYSLLFLWVSICSVKATHIVGGEMNYTCLGNNEYEITLTIFRDCFYGNPNAWFDNPASIGVFDVNNELLQEIQIPLMNNDTLQPTLSGDCFVVPPDVCVHTTTYAAIVTLPPIIGGYQLAYQRCCRNQTIVNIIDPLGTGATYGLTISEQALLECNSSPQFEAWPPLYICVNEPIVFDQSAVDVDGDSIVYKLCAPLQGADPNIPQPQPPNPPPYDPVTWVDPPFGVDNMLNGVPGGQPLEIDPQTGLLTGLPNTVGQFVVGICIEEYRNGILISTTRRDFQYNVGVCGQWVASFFAPEVQCEDFEVSFDNQSYGTDQFLWNFGDPTNPGFTSMETSPLYVYPDTGLYQVILIAGPDNPCVDTFQQEVYLQYNSLFPDFSFALETCTDSMAIQVTDLSMDTLFEITNWYWEFLPGSEQTSNLQNPVFYAYETGVYTVQLTVTAENGCEKTISQAIFVDLIEEELEGDTLQICFGEAIGLNDEFSPVYQYQWAPEADFEDPSLPNPIVSPPETTTYSVTISDADDFCHIERSITVAVAPPLEIIIPEDTVICAPDILLTASAEGALFYEWSADAAFTAVLTYDSLVTVSPIGEMTYYIRVLDENECPAVDSVTIVGNGVDLLKPDTVLACLGTVPEIGVANIDPADVLSFSWQPEALILSESDLDTISVMPGQPGPTVFYLTTENQYGCISNDSVIVYMIDTTSQEALVEAVPCSGYTVLFASSSVNAPYYTWFFNDPDGPVGQTAHGAEVAYTFSGPGTYEVAITLPESLVCSDTIFFPVTVTEPAIVLDFEWSLEICTDTALVQFTDLSQNQQSEIVQWAWDFGNGNLSDQQNPTAEFATSSPNQVTLVITSSDGCVDSLSQIVITTLVEETLQDSLLICLGDSIELNPILQGDYEYLWSPSGSLSSPVSPNPWASPEVTTTYTALISSLENICAVERSVTVVVPPPISYILSPDTVVCEDTYLLFAESEEAIDFAWSADPEFTFTLSEQPEFEVALGGIESIIYVRMTDIFGCSVTDQVTVESHAIQVALEDEITLCVGDTISLEVINLLADELMFSWSPVDAIIEGADTNEPLVSPPVSTLFQVSINNDYGCTLDTAVMVNIFNFIPPLDITATPDTILLGESSILTATDDLTYSYFWTPVVSLNFDDIPQVIATPEETTTYEVIVRDENGCVNQALVTIVVLVLECGEPYVFIPTGFTPDGDGLNDELEVYGNNIQEMYLVIYDRWGELVFESRDQSVKWDGTFKGNELPPGTFGFYLEVICDDGDQYIKKGNITLLR
jgi:gliding motility-associated-like protein